ncbi:MAG: hypothetical protein R8G34_13980 [Paracoccaceae bacterium]|nr:hypothetical protein [Paracoccaceae bacterium]
MEGNENMQHEVGLKSENQDIGGFTVPVEWTIDGMMSNCDSEIVELRVLVNL